MFMDITLTLTLSLEGRGNRVLLRGAAPLLNSLYTPLLKVYSE
jgi:hypothetical protein